MAELVGDLVCVLQHARVNSAICVGYCPSFDSRVQLTVTRHDWGSQVCYEAARMRPDIFTAVVGITVPVDRQLSTHTSTDKPSLQYLPSNAEFIPIRTLVHALPRLAYQLFFDRDHAAATAQLDQDIRRTIRATHRTADSPPPDAFLTHHDSFLEGWKDVEEVSCCRVLFEAGLIVPAVA